MRAPTLDRARLVADAAHSISAGSKSFRFASQIFDQPTRERSWMLYAWCRACDDITDGQTLGHDAQVPDNPDERIAFLRARTEDALANRATGLVPFEALRQVTRECHIPAAVTDDHLAGFARDAAAWRPDSEEDLLSYCYQVAGSVGVMMAHVMGVTPGEEDTLDRAADLGIAFQLANIARDIVEDAKVGRVYLPTEWLAAESLLDSDLAEPKHRAALARMTRRLADLAEKYRASSKTGAARLPFRSRWAVLAAAGIYGEVATRAAALGQRAWDSRITTGKWEKAALVMEAYWEALLPVRKTERTGLWTRPRYPVEDPLAPSPPRDDVPQAQPSAARLEEPTGSQS